VSSILARSAESGGTASRRAYSVCARSSARRWMPAHRAAASAEASPPGDAATLIASCRAEPFAYASTSRDRQPAAAAERRAARAGDQRDQADQDKDAEWTHSQVRLVAQEEEEEEEAPGAAEPVADAAVVTLCVGGCALTLGLPEAVAVRLGRLPIELMLLPHPAASNPAIRTGTGTDSLFGEGLVLILPHRDSQPLEPPSPATGTVTDLVTRSLTHARMAR